MNRLVLIDGHAILHRAFHALPPLTTSKGELVNAVFGFTSILLRVIADLKPTHLAICFDLPKPTFRKKIFKEYQAKRPKMAQELTPQIDIVHKVVKEMGISIFEMDGYEADDVIGTIAKQTQSSKLKTSRLSGIHDAAITHSSQAASGQSSNIDEVIIVTGDRDILQLVCEHIKVYMPVKGLSESKLYGEKEVEEKFGIRPEQIIDYKALVGDQSDNYQGVSGIGPKTATSLLTSFHTLEEIYKHLDRIKDESLRKKLAKDIKTAELAKQLATIITDVPIAVNLEKCKLQNLDRPNIHHLFEELEFRSLIPRLASRNNKQETINKKPITKNKIPEEKNSEQISLF